MPLTPMRLLRLPEPFDHPDFLFEPKLDGFRALAHVRGHRCELISRNGHTFKQWPQLAEEVAHAVGDVRNPVTVQSQPNSRATRG
jgi:bifunctional non-homologous end joining protein LigD